MNLTKSDIMMFQSMTMILVLNMKHQNINKNIKHTVIKY